MAYTVYSDLNVRLENVNTSDATTIVDKEAILQSLNRFIRVEKGEIPYFRSYGLYLKQFSQYPLTKATAEDIFQYCKVELETYEKRITVISALTDALVDEGIITMSFTCKITATNQVITTETVTINVS